MGHSNMRWSLERRISMIKIIIDVDIFRYQSGIDLDIGLNELGILINEKRHRGDVKSRQLLYIIFFLLREFVFSL